MTKKKDVATKSDNLPASPIDQFDTGSTGLEDVGSDDLLIPRLSILQGLSPQIKPSKPEYIQGAKDGDICDVGMGEVFPDGVLFLPVMFQKVWVRWSPRETGKGLVEIYHDEEIASETTRNIDDEGVPTGPPTFANGDILNTTFQFFGLNLSAGRRRCFIPMTSVMLKRGRRWVSWSTSEKLQRADGSEFTPPFYYRTYKLSTVPESNSKGDWNTWNIERSVSLPELNTVEGHESPPWQNIMEDAKDFLETLNDGKAKADLSSMATETGDAGEEGAM